MKLSFRGLRLSLKQRTLLLLELYSGSGLESKRNMPRKSREKSKWSEHMRSNIYHVVFDSENIGKSFRLLSEVTKRF